jgi:hypothetical protein
MLVRDFGLKGLYGPGDLGDMGVSVCVGGVEGYMHQLCIPLSVWDASVTLTMISIAQDGCILYVTFGVAPGIVRSLVGSASPCRPAQTVMLVCCTGGFAFSVVDVMVWT